MDFTTLGDTGLEVSRICLGGDCFGGGADWKLDGEEARAVLDRAIDLGINFFDLANKYSDGDSERIVGKAIQGHRERSVVASKVFFPMDESNPNSGGLFRKTIEEQLAASLDRIGIDTLDLYMAHRWDDTPTKTMLEAFDALVRRGEVRHVGACSMWTHEFAEAVYEADRRGLARFSVMQNLYNLAYREEEREMLPFCAKEEIGVMPWSPMAGGYLTRPHEEFDTTTRRIFGPGDTTHVTKSSPTASRS